MANPTEKLERFIGFLHSFGVAASNPESSLANIEAKSGHNMSANEIRMESVPFALSSADADAAVAANPTMIKKFTKVPLSVYPNSNGHCYYLQVDGKVIDNMIDPRDSQRVGDSGALQSSIGYSIKLYTSDGNTEIMPAWGVWLPVYHNGLILIGQTNTAGLGEIKNGSTVYANSDNPPLITCYQYIGKTAANASGEIEWITDPTK